MEKKRKITIITLTIASILLVIAGATYAWWQLTKKQSDMNELVAACLDFELTNADNSKTGINLINAEPITVDDAYANPENNYGFVVTNKCSQKIDYLVALENLTPAANQISGESLIVSLDNKIFSAYNDLTNTDPADANASDAKILEYDSLEGNAQKTYSLGLFINRTSEIEDSGKTFSSKIFITSGQIGESSVKLTDDECFTISSSGVITNYDSSCGKDVVVPASINDIQVKEIATNAFRKVSIVSEEANAIALYNENDFSDIKVLILDEELEDIIKFHFAYYYENYSIITLDEYLAMDKTGYIERALEVGYDARTRNSDGVSYDASTADVYIVGNMAGTDSETGKPILDIKVYIYYSGDFVNLIKQLIIDTLKSRMNMSPKSTIEFVDSIPASYDMEIGYFGVETYDNDERTYNIVGELAIDKLDLSNAVFLEYVDSFAFSNLDHAPKEAVVEVDDNDGDLSYWDAGDYKGLTSLKLPRLANLVTLGIGSFAGADLDELIYYNNLTEIYGLVFRGETGKYTDYSKKEEEYFDTYTCDADVYFCKENPSFAASRISNLIFKDGNGTHQIGTVVRLESLGSTFNIYTNGILFAESTNTVGTFGLLLALKVADPFLACNISNVIVDNSVDTIGSIITSRIQESIELPANLKELDTTILSYGNKGNVIMNRSLTDFKNNVAFYAVGLPITFEEIDGPDVSHYLEHK